MHLKEALARRWTDPLTSNKNSENRLTSGLKWFMFTAVDKVMNTGNLLRLIVEGVLEFPALVLLLAALKVPRTCTYQNAGKIDSWFQYVVKTSAKCEDDVPITTSEQTNNCLPESLMTTKLISGPTRKDFRGWVARDIVNSQHQWQKTTIVAMSKNIRWIPRRYWKWNALWFLLQ